MFRKLLLMTLLFAGFLSACKKKDTTTITTTFTQPQGQAVSGQYTLTGHITSTVSLLKVIVTKEGQSAPFITDDTTAKNKNEYDFSYLITGITADTYIILTIYDQNNKITTARFLIKA
ncbi:hypothetical protein BH09BAC2_BH09BAC2_22160 [soil metagenome]